MERPAALRIFIHATYCMKEQSYMKLHSFFESLRELRHFLLLFTTQALSSLGSAMTSYALVIWAYQ